MKNPENPFQMSSLWRGILSRKLTEWVYYLPRCKNMIGPWPGVITGKPTLYF